LTSTWNQDNPYNAMCPEDASGPGGRVYVGCVATAMAEIMHYWRFPLTGEGSNSYYHYPYGTISANFGDAEYDWNGMTDEISNKFIWEIAEIGFHAGVAVEMMYAGDGSGAYSQDVPAAMRNHFRFQSSVQYLSKSSYTTSTWENMMQTELDNFRPIYYSGRTTDNSGHAFVCDAYQGMNYYHFNFGWSGSSNGYYSLQSVGGFHVSQAMIRNIYPGDAAYPYFASEQTDLGTLVGSFTDGSGPAEDYISGMDASWLISPQNEEDSVTSITLSFIEFNTDASDMLRVYDGANDNAELLGEFSGDNLPSNITSSSNQMFITFSSTETAPGFKIEYSSQIPTWCTSTAYSEPEGTITDGSLNFFYNNSTTCIITLAHPEATKYYVDFTEMNTEPLKDKIRLYNDSGTLLGEFSGDELPDPIVSETGSLMLMWSTNSSIRNEGWSFDYHVDGVGFEETTVENLAIYPNPTTGMLNVKFNTEKQGDMQIKLMSVNGQVIFNEEITNTSGQYNYSFDISDRAKGIYLLSIISDNEKIDRKIVLK
ncbi:MAG: C10 family peptidase, partial [Bacteroidota bacterium]